MRGRNFNGLGSLSSHASSMIGSLKGNLRRKEITNFKSPKETSKYKKRFIDKKASPKLLKEIRERIQRENKRNKLIAIISITSTVTILYILFNFVKF